MYELCIYCESVSCSVKHHAGSLVPRVTFTLLDQGQGHFAVNLLWVFTSDHTTTVVMPPYKSLHLGNGIMCNTNC